MTTTVPSTTTETIVEFGVKQWVVDLPSCNSLTGWWDDQETAEKALDLALQSKPDWTGVVVKRTRTTTMTTEEV